MENTQANKINSFIQYLEECIEVSDEELCNCIQQLDLKLSDIQNHLRFDHSPKESYGRSVIYESNKLEIVVMSWNQGDFTSIHDHGFTQWGAVLSFGKIQNTLFELQDNHLIIKDRQFFENGDICFIDNQLIHQMGNPFDSPAISFHVYGTNQQVNEVTAESRTYEPVNKTIYYANGGAFLEIPKVNIVREEPCPPVQDEIFHEYVAILMKYYDKLDCANFPDSLDKMRNHPNNKFDSKLNKYESFINNNSN